MAEEEQTTDTPAEEFTDAVETEDSETEPKTEPEVSVPETPEETKAETTE